MECRKASESTSAFIDGELAPDARREFLAHVGSCPSCADELRNLEKSTAEVSAHAGGLELRPEVWNRVKARISEMPAPDRRLRGWGILFGTRLRLAATYSLLAIVVVSGTVSIVQSRRSRAALEAYMNDYIQARRSQQQGRFPPHPGETAVPPAAENPFLDVDYSGMIVNPFMSEGR